MITKKRLFANSNEMNFVDYIKNKSGVEILKNTKSKIGNQELTYFFSYNDFINLTKVFFRYLNKNKCVTTAVPISLNDTNTSFILIQEHMNHCSFCKDYDSLCSLDCHELKNILYPYENF